MTHNILARCSIKSLKSNLAHNFGYDVEGEALRLFVEINEENLDIYRSNLFALWDLENEKAPDKEAIRYLKQDVKDGAESMIMIDQLPLYYHHRLDDTYRKLDIHTLVSCIMVAIN